MTAGELPGLTPWEPRDDPRFTLVIHGDQGLVVSGPLLPGREQQAVSEPETILGSKSSNAVALEKPAAACARMISPR